MQIRAETAVLAAGVTLLPVYLFPSGGVQPAHAILALFAAMALVRHGVPVTGFFLAFAALVLHVLGVELWAAMRDGRRDHLVHPLFLCYNLALAAALAGHLRAAGPGGLARALVAAVAVALATLAAQGGLTLAPQAGAGPRVTGSFNNPNQLGYFAVCVLSLAYVLHRAGALGTRAALALGAVAVLLTLVSLSKAAMVAVLAVLAVALRPRPGRWRRGLWRLGVALAVLGTGALALDGRLDHLAFAARLGNLLSENDSSLAARGYFALRDSGAGAGAALVGLGAARIEAIVGHEVHSTIGAVANAYGAVGLALLAAMLWAWGRAVTLAWGWSGLVCVLGPPMLYGLTHNGIRFTIFWVLVATSLALARRAREGRAPHPAAPAAPAAAAAPAGRRQAGLA